MGDKVKTVSSDIFFAEIKSLLVAGKQVQIIVRGRSMRPMLEHERDKVTLQQRPLRDYQRGDVVLARTTIGQWVLHRIVSCDESTCTLQGDGNVVQREACLRAEILGRVVQFTRKSRTCSVEHWQWRIYRWLWMHSVLLRRPLLLAYEVVHRTKRCFACRQ